MGTTSRMAWRSLARNRRRSAVTASGIALAMAMCMATLGLMDGLSQDLIHGTVDGEVGDVQVHQRDYLATRHLTDTVPATALDLRRLRADTQVRAASRRLYAWGYLSGPRGAGGVQLMGIDPGPESRVTRLAATLVAGRFVPDAPTPWPEPRPLSGAQRAEDQRLTQAAIDQAFAQVEGRPAPPRADLSARTRALSEQLAPAPLRPPAAVLGVRLAAHLGARVGDTVQLLYQNTLGAQGTLSLKVAGLSRSGLDVVDRSRVLLHVDDLQKMLLLTGRAHEIALRVRDPRAADAVAADLNTRFGAGSGERAQSWSQVRPDITALIAANQSLMGSLVVIVFLIAGTGVLNTMLVSVMERQKEISVMKALGQTPLGIVAMILLETLLLAGAACAAGLALGALAELYLREHGVDVSRFGDFSLSGVNFAPVMRASLTPASALVPLASLLAVALLAAWAPARLAARVLPATGLRSGT